MEDKIETRKLNEYIEWIKKYNTPKWLYRLEYKDDSCGLWYNGKGDWCFEKGIGSLDDTCKTKSLGMDYDERYRQDGRSWFSSCSRKEDLLHWYSKEDARKLIENGFIFTRYLATEYHEYDFQTVFIKETALCREEIDFFSLMKNNKNKELELIENTKNIIKSCDNFLLELDEIDEGIKFLQDEYKNNKKYFREDSGKTTVNDVIRTTFEFAWSSCKNYIQK